MFRTAHCVSLGLLLAECGAAQSGAADAGGDFQKQ